MFLNVYNLEHLCVNDFINMILMENYGMVFLRFRF